MEWKNILIGLFLVGAGFFYFLHHVNSDGSGDGPFSFLGGSKSEPATIVKLAHPAATPDSHLAPPGTLFLLTYTSVPTPHGPIGLLPGQEVRLVGPDPRNGGVVITAGEYLISLPSNQVTNNLDIAAQVRRGDQTRERRTQTYIESQHNAAVTAKQAADIRYAQEVERVNALNRSKANGGTPPPH